MAKQHDTPKRAAMAREALHRAETGQSSSNYFVIFSGMLDKGIPESEIKPRENILTFLAWRAKGRTVKRGEKGVRVITWIPVKRTDKKTGEETKARIPRNAYVFHVSQTKALESATA